MQKVIFGNSMVKIRQVILWSTLLQFVFALAAGLMFYFDSRRLTGVIEFTAALALVVFFSVLAFLGLYYLRKPEVREKKRLLKQIQRVEKDLNGIQAELADALQKKGAIRDHLQTQRDSDREAFEALTSRLESQISGLRTAKEEKLASELARIQQEHIETGLKGMPLDPALVPGIGAALAEKLFANGIRTAFDVNQEAIHIIPGFGEAKILSLTRWRESEERKLQDSPTGFLVRLR